MNKGIYRGGLRERKARIKLLMSAVLDFEQELLDALKTDLDKHEAEATLQEIYPLKKEAQHTISNLGKWMGKRYASTPLALIGTRHYVRAEPKGRVLIISPWNYPVMLTLKPLIGALAAGNFVVVKPSEHTPTVSSVLKKLLESVFTEDIVKVVPFPKTVFTEILPPIFKIAERTWAIPIPLPLTSDTSSLVEKPSSKIRFI